MEGMAMAASSKSQTPRKLGLPGMFRSMFPRQSAHVVRCEEIPEVPGSAASPASREEPPVHFEMFNREWMQTSQQDNFDGFRLEAANQVTKHLQAAHTLFLGTQATQTGYIYQFGPAFQSEDGRTVLVARVSIDGAVNGRMIRKVGDRFELKMSSNSDLKDAQRNMQEGGIEYTATDWTAAGKLAWQGAWLLSGAFSQRIIPSLHLGGDLTLVPMNGVTIGQVGARYSPGKDNFTVNVSRTPDPRAQPGANVHEIRMNYLRKITERLSLGSEFKYSHPDKESGMSLAYEYSFRQARVQGLLDTDGKVNCCVSDFTGFGFSGMIDYFRGDYKFGIVMHVLPQPEGGGAQPM